MLTPLSIWEWIHQTQYLPAEHSSTVTQVFLRLVFDEKQVFEVGFVVRNLYTLQNSWFWVVGASK